MRQNDEDKRNKKEPKVGFLCAYGTGERWHVYFGNDLVGKELIGYAKSKVEMEALKNACWIGYQTGRKQQGAI